MPIVTASAAVVGLRSLIVQSEVATRASVWLTFPRGVKGDQLQAFVQSLGGLLPPWWERLFRVPAIAFETHASDDGIAHRILVPSRYREYVLAQTRAHLPGTRVETDNAQPPIRIGWELRVSSRLRPLRSDAPESSAAGLLATLQPLRHGERIVVQWILTPLPARRVRSVLPHLLRRGATTDPAQFIAETAREATAIRDKASAPHLCSVVRIGARAAETRRARSLLRRVLGAFHAGDAPGVSFRRRWLPSSWVAARINAAAVPVADWPSVVTAGEAAAFLGAPLGEPRLPGLRTGASPQLAPVREIPSLGRVLGRANFPGAERPLALSETDSLRHLQVIGPTGVGKSSVLARLAVGDMNAGHGVIVVDPKGDLVADVLARVPSHRARDVVLLDPTDVSHPVGFNLLAATPASAETVADGVVSIFRHLYSAFWGPRTDDILRAAILTLVAEPGMTLCEVPLLLTDEPFRRRLLGRLDDPIGLEPFWGWYEGLSDGERSQAIGPVLNKLRAFLLRRRLRNVIGQSQSSFSMEAVLENRGILLVSLAKGVLGEDASALLGSALLAKLWQAVQARAALAPHERAAVYCHVDEFQDYLNLPTSLADVLAQARGYGLGMTLAHQHLGQLPREIRDAVLSNARSRLVFQTAASDASALAREFGPDVEPADLQALGPYEAVLAAAAGDRVCPPATLSTLPLGPQSKHGPAARALSRQTYGRPIEEVETDLRERHRGGRASVGVGRRRRS